MKNGVQPVGYISIPHVRSVSEKFECKDNRYNKRCSFKMRHTLRNSLM